MYQTVNAGTPTAHITVNRNRVKMYGPHLYLRSGTNFEIELFNPKTIRVLAKIFVNEIPISDAGLVINPGQRVYLERYIDVDRKFNFSTYSVENSKAAKAAIANNGAIRVEFYDEIAPTGVDFWITTIQKPIQPIDPIPWLGDPGIFYHNSTGGGFINTPTATTNSNMLLDNSKSYSTTSFNASSFMDSSKTVMGNKLKKTKSNGSKSIETGRIEMGEKSNQRIGTTNGSFSSWQCARYSYKIFPESERPIEIKEVRSYCTKCGRKIKNGWEFCPTCGTKTE